VPLFLVLLIIALFGLRDALNPASVNRRVVNVLELIEPLI
jgi:hypothetical protein